jgi:predicted Zn-dependent protease
MRYHHRIRHRLIPIVMVSIIVAGCASAPVERASSSELAAQVAKEQEVGDAAFAKLAGTYGLVTDDEATAYLNKYLQSLALYTERQELTYRAAILDTDQVNAYALPGGYVLVTLGTLHRMESPGELAGVLAHELGHIRHKHILDNVNIEVEYSAIESLARVIAGGRQLVNAAMAQVNDAIEERLFYEGYQAEDEYEADAYAVLMLGSIGISAREYRSFLSRLEEESAGTDALENLAATHPPLSERLSRIDERMEEVNDPSLPSLVATDSFDQFLARVSRIEVQTAEEIQ